MRYSRLTVISAARAAASMSPPVDRPLLEQIVAEVFVHEGGAAGARGRCIDHRVERPVVDGDGGGEVLGFGAGRRDAGGDRLADIAHLVGRERRPGRRAGAGRLRHHPDRLDPRQVGRGEDPAPRGGRDGDRADVGVGVRAAQEHDLLGTAQRDVRDELAAAAQVAIVLLAQQRRADPVALTGVFIRHHSSPKARSRSREDEPSCGRRQHCSGGARFGPTGQISALVAFDRAEAAGRGVRWIGRGRMERKKPKCRR